MALEKFATASSRRQQASGLCSPDLGVRSPEKKKPSTCFQGAGFWRRPTDSLSPTRSPATRAGLTVYPPASQHGVFSARVGDTKKTPADHLTCGCSVLATSYSRTAYRRTTIGAAAFHCRVRNGNGWGHCAIVTRN